jgi:hypothetical protein
MGDNKKKMSAMFSDTIRHIIDTSNELSLQREDIVSLIKEGGQYVLIYFK